MKTSRLSAALFASLLAAPAFAQDFSSAQTEWRVMLARTPVRPEAGIEAVIKAADAGSWKSLLDHVRSAKSARLEKINSGSSIYEVSALATEKAAFGQDCPAGQHPQNSVFVSKLVSGPGKDVYPVRLTASCRDGSGVKDIFSIDTDESGTVEAVTLFSSSLGVTVYPSNKPMGDQPAAVTALTSRLIKLFLELP